MDLLPLIILVIISLSLSSHAKLTPDHYAKSCPKFAEIVQDAAFEKQDKSPTTAAATLRVFFHDCMVTGCDGSILVSSNAFNKAERDAEENINLPGDAFDLITRAKTSLELVCPGVVSCADILAQATRDLITMVGGPFYEVRLGRKDSLFSHAADVPGRLPKGGMTLDQVIDIFKGKGFTVQELVALIGSHTIGFSHCKEFAPRVFNFSATNPVDPSLHPMFANRLKTLCANYEANPAMSAFNDVMSPGKFDNTYYQNLKRGLGLLPIDQMIYNDPRTREFADRYAANQTEFFGAYTKAIEKVGRLDVKIGAQGEVRKQCDTINSVKFG